MKPLRHEPQTYHVELDAKSVDEPNEAEVSGTIGGMVIPNFIINEKDAEVIGNWFLKLSSELQKKRFI